MKEEPSARLLRWRRLVLLFCAAALSAYQLFAAGSMFPVPGGDAVVFMPPAINLKAGRGLTNSLWAVNPDATGQNRYLEHPPLFPMVVAACMWKAENRNAFVVLALFDVLALWIYAAVLCTAGATRRLLASGFGFAVLLSSLSGLSFLIFTSAAGRPENLSVLIVVSAIAVVAWGPRKSWPWSLGIAIGVAAAVHPTHGIFLGCLVALAFLLTETVPSAAREMALAAVVALPLFCLLLSLSPYSIRETLQAIATHSAYANAADYRLSSLGTYYLRLAPSSGLYLLGFALVLSWLGIHVWKHAPDRVTRAVRLGGVLLAASVFWFFSIRRPNASYYLLLLAPAVATAVFYLFDARHPMLKARLTTAPLYIAAAFFLVFSLCLARDMALFVNYKTKGVSFVDARNEFRRILQSNKQPVGVSESLWVLTEEFDRIRIVERGSASGELMVLQQTQRQSLTPPSYPGYHLLTENFLPYPPTCLGIRLGRTMPGYASAVLETDAVAESSPLPRGSLP